MEMLIALFITPLANMAENPEFVLEVVIGGLLSGVMYSLVALGFVLIFKASGVFNFAQGTMVLFAALTFVGMIERGVPIWGAFVIAATATRNAAQTGRPRSSMPTKVSAANSTIVPWAKLNTPEAL